MPLGAILLLLLASTAFLYFFAEKQVNWVAFVAMAVFYLIIFGIGAYAAGLRGTEETSGFMLADRKMPLWLGVFTMSATWIGGGYINGTAEYAATSGLVWVQAPWGYALSLMVGGLVFARPMRRQGYQTMLDPLEERFGKKMAALLFLPALSGELFWTAAILSALGSTFAVIVGLDTSMAIILSATITIIYTILGGLWAVALTDVVQLILLFVGLFLVVPFALESQGGLSAAWTAYKAHYGAAASLLPTREALGSYYWNWWDSALLLIFGGIPWQVYFQRVLSSKSEKTAMYLSIFAGVVCLVAAIPPLLCGIVATTAEWAVPPPDGSSTLPWVMRYLTPEWVGVIGLGAIAGAVMSSADSSILSASSLAAWNVWRPFSKKSLTDRQLQKLIRRLIGIVGVSAILIALQANSVYELWFLCSDFVYCLLFPALVAALFDPKANTYGAISGFLVALVLRFGGGDATLGIPVFLPYPMVEEGICLFPFRTLAMVSGLATIFVVSRWTNR